MVNKFIKQNNIMERKLITDENREKLEALGYAIMEFPNGIIHIHNNDERQGVSIQMATLMAIVLALNPGYQVGSFGEMPGGGFNFIITFTKKK